MSRTLFRYIFVDLVRIFLITSGALSGIMSFGGLLRPLMQQGLDAAQVGQMLTYLSPAMMAYAFPIAALFATTVVYGRLSADNEIVACRASGISHLALAWPAIVLGLATTLLSLGFLCFIVPTFTLKVEQVVYSNVAKLIANKIERSHSIKFEQETIFARRADIVSDPSNPEEQRVVLTGPTIIRYGAPDPVTRSKPATELYMAERATVIIRQGGAMGQASSGGVGEQDAELLITLDNGVRFPRERAGAVQGGIGATQYGPVPIDSPIGENTKFMVIGDLKKLYQQPWLGTKIRRWMNQFVKDDQSQHYLQLVHDELQQQKRIVFQAQNETYVLTSGGGGVAFGGDEDLVLPARDDQRPSLRQERDGHTNLVAEADTIHIGAAPSTDGKRMIVTVRMDRVTTITNEPVERERFDRIFSVPMPESVQALEVRRTQPELYASSQHKDLGASTRLRRDLIRLSNEVQSEMHSRVAFATSCLVLVMVGCALGMMFKSGNFLTAFAISFIPALFCITLIIAGQRTTQNVPTKFWLASDALSLGINLIWTGNVIVCGIGAALLWRLHRQ